MIYGLPGQTLEEWQENLDDAIRLEIPHISAYHLIYEEGTALYKLMEAGKVTPIEEDLSVTLFSTLINRLTEAGYLHYEISNFGRPGYFSRHNSSYWTGTKYIGIGPSAHSYDGESRQWNISSLPRYLQGIKAGIPDIEIEELDINTKYNDFIITGLRTMWGIRTADIRERFGEEKQTYLEQQAATYLRQGLLIRENDTLTLSKKGIFISDGIMSDLYGYKGMLQTFDKAIKLHQTACFYNELRGYPYIFCTFLLFLRIKLTNILNYYLYLPQQKTVSSAISIHNIGMQRSRKNDSFLHNSSRDVEV